MFVQVIKGRVSDPDAMRAMLDRWVAEESAGAAGWLGTTSGVTDDGTFVSLARFESQEAARANSDRPGQDAWWADASALFDGKPTFHDCTDVLLMGAGGSDAAGFVQVMEGHVHDMARMRELNDEIEAAGVADARKDVIGGVVALHGDGGYTSAMFFTSEQEARRGESRELPERLHGLFEEQTALHDGPVTFRDLHRPWLHSPG